MRVVIKKELCIGCEICVNTCPEVFLEWGLHMRAVFEVREPDRYGALVRQAVEDCPARAISVRENGASADGPGG